MNKEFLFSNTLFDKELDEKFDEQTPYHKDKDIDLYLTESDFYPPCDNRMWKSNVADINGGDNFADYCEYFFRMLEKEEYYDN